MTMKERREALNLTQTEVAKILGCTASNISFYESGAYRPKYPRAKKLAKIYGCTVEEIMEGCETGDES